MLVESINSRHVVGARALVSQAAAVIKSPRRENERLEK
jgi:hypothetical protein